MCMDHFIAHAIDTNKIFGHLYQGHNLVVKHRIFNKSGLLFTDVFWFIFHIFRFYRNKKRVHVTRNYRQGLRTLLMCQTSLSTLEKFCHIVDVSN